LVEPAPLTLDAPRPLPDPPRPVEVARDEPRPTPPEPKRQQPVVIEPPKPVVSVGAFPTNAAAHAFEPPRSVEQAGFDAPAARASQVRAATTKAGAFDQQPSATPRLGSDHPNIVVEAGFGTTTASRPSTPARSVGDSGFGAAAPSRKPAPEPAVQGAGFDERPAPQVARAPREVRVEVPAREV